MEILGGILSTRGCDAMPHPARVDRLFKASRLDEDLGGFSPPATAIDIRQDRHNRIDRSGRRRVSRVGPNRIPWARGGGAIVHPMGIPIGVLCETVHHRFRCLNQRTDSLLMSSTNVPPSDPTEPEHAFAADALASGIAVMFAMTVIQRGLGFFRSIWFCRWMSDYDVGIFSIGYDFIVMMTPVVMLGIPGSLARYVQTYLNQGQLVGFLRRIAGLTLGLGVAMVIAMTVFPSAFSNLIYALPFDGSVAGTSNVPQLLAATAAGVAAIVIYNFTYELMAALRQVRVASWMQFAQSMLFSVLSLGYLAMGGGVVGVIFAFVIATVLTTLPAGWFLNRRIGRLQRPLRPFPGGTMWRRLAPYAASLWLMNFLTNIFCMSDRYMILHFMQGGIAEATAAVGQYHSARIIPLLLTSVATMISGVLVPYLAADWESGDRSAVIHRLRRTYAMLSVAFTIGGGLAIATAPWVFATLLENRYTEGLALMPAAMVFCTWASLAVVAQDYLWVAERGGWVAPAVGAGLAANIALTLWWLPSHGPAGAVYATVVANAVVLVTLWAIMARMDFTIDRTVVMTTVLPALILIGPAVAIAAGLVMCVMDVTTREFIETGWGTIRNRMRPVATGTA